MSHEITDGQWAHINNLVQSIIRSEFRKGRVTRAEAQKLPNNPNFRNLIASAIRMALGPDDKFKFAREILGIDFISPEEVSSTLGLSYDGDLQNKFLNGTPSIEDLGGLHTNKTILIPGPPRPLSLEEIFNLFPQYFSNRGQFLDRENSTFFTSYTVKTNWIALRKVPIENSLNLSWGSQMSFIKSTRFLPNIAEIAWCLIVFHQLRSVFLLNDLYVRSTSSASDSSQVCIGNLGTEGFRIFNYGNTERLSTLGLITARRFTI
jgi:hypothetical protein